MKKLQKIMIPIDFSPVSVNAVQYANGILEKHPAEVVLVFVSTPENKMEVKEIKKACKVFEEEALQGVSFFYEFDIAKGNLLNELIKAKAIHKADMVIMGTKGKRASDLSLASAYIRSVYCPVLVVPEHYKNNQIRRIAFANDYKPIRDHKAIKPLWEFALTFGAKVYLLHVNYSKKEELVPADDAENAIEYYLQSLEHEYAYLSSDDVEYAINHYIKENKIDLLVFLTRDHGRNHLKSEGRLIAQLTAHAQIPVLALC